MENLEGFVTQGAVLRHGNKVLAVTLNYKGFKAAVYQVTEKTGVGDTEWGIELEEACPLDFEDGGHAMAWCFRKISK